MLIYDRASGGNSGGNVPAAMFVRVGRPCLDKLAWASLSSSPYVFDQRNGWMIGVSFGLKSDRREKITCRQIAIVTDMGNGAVEVKVFDSLFLPELYGMDPNTANMYAAMQSQPLHERGRTIGHATHSSTQLNTSLLSYIKGCDPR